jgi:hypothetical protein
MIWVEATSESVNESDKSENEPVRERLGKGRMSIAAGNNLSLFLFIVLTPDKGSRESMTGAIHCSYAIHVDTTTRPKEVTTVLTNVRMEVYLFFKQSDA